MNRLVTLLACWPATLWAASAAPLEAFLQGLVSYEARFTQTIHDNQGKLIESGSGVLRLQRPGKFAWDYQTAGAAGGAGQLLLADGRNLWYFDRDLEQVTVRPQSAALVATPMALLTAPPDEWRAAFEFPSATRRAGLQVQSIVPRGASAEFARAELVFKGAQLQSMQVFDRLGQRVQLTFAAARRNPRLPASAFQFSAPSGVDVIGKAAP